MLANLLVVLGVLVLLHSASTYLLPNLHSRTWRSRTTSGARATTAFSSSQLSWNAPKSFDSKMVQPSVIARPAAVAGDSPPKHIILSTLKTGMKLDGYVVSSTPYAAFIDAGVVRVSKGGSFAPVHAMLHKSDIPKEVLNSLRKGQHQFPSPIPGPSPLLPKNTPLSVFVKEVTKQTGRFTVTTDSTVTKADLSLAHNQVREEASERRRSRRLRRQLEDITPGTTAEGLVDKVVDEGVLVTITSLGSLNVTGLIRKQDMPQHLRVPESIKVSHQNQLLQQDFVPGRPITCAISDVHPTPHTANVYNLKLTFEDFNGQIEDDEPVEDIFDTMTAKEQKAWLLNRKVEDLNDDDDQEDEDEEDNYDEDGEENDRDDFEQDFGDFDQEVTELYEELLSASAERIKGKLNPARLLPVESVYDWDAVQDMISSGELEKSDVDQAVRRAGVPLRGGTLSLAQFKDVVEGLQDKMHANEEEEEDDDESDGEQEKEELRGLLRDARAAQEQQAHQKKGKGGELKGNKEEEEDEYDEYTDDDSEGEEYDLQYGEDEGEEEDRDQGNYDDSDGGDDDAEENGEEEEEQSFDEIVTEVFDELKNEQNLVPVSTFKAWDDVQDMLEGGVIRTETLDMLIEEIIKSTPSAGGKNKNVKQNRNKKMAEPALTFDQFSQLARLLDEMVTAQEDAADYDREQLENKRVQVRDADEEGEDGDDYQDEEDYENDEGDAEEDSEARGELSEEEQEVIDAADAKEAFQELSKDGKVVTVKSLRAWDEIRDLLEEEILDQESLDVLIRTANGDLTTPMNLETFSDLLTLINDAVSSAEGDGEDDGEYADYDDADEEEEEAGENERDFLNQRSTNSAQKVSASVDEREAERARLIDRAESRNDEEEEEEEEEDPSDEELEVLAKQAYDELLPKGRTTLPVKVFETWPSVQEEVTAGMLTNEEIRYVLKKVDPRNTHQLTFEQFTTAMDMLEMKIQERAEEMEQQELDDAQEREKEEGDEDSYDDGEDDGSYEDEEKDGYSVDFDEYDDIDEDNAGEDQPAPVAATAATTRALPSTTTAASFSLSSSAASASQSVKSSVPAANKASPAKSVPSGPGVGFDKVTLPDTKTTTPPVKKTKKSVDGDAVQVPTSLEDTEKEIDQLMDEMTQALYDELRGDEAVLTVEKFKQWKELQDIFNDGVVSKSFFDRAVKAAGASPTGPINWKQFGAVLDAVQTEVEKSFPEDDDSDDGDEVDELEDAKAKAAQAKALAKVQEKAARAQKDVKPTAEAVSAGLNEDSARKNENYDFTKVFETLEEIEQKETGKRKSKKPAAVAAPTPVAVPTATTGASTKPPSVSDITAGTNTQSSESQDEDEFPVEKSVDELAQETYDRLRGTQAQPTVEDLLHWEDLIELIDRRALTGEQLVQALSDAKIDPDREKDVVSLDQFVEAVQNIDQYIDFSKLDVPDLSRYDQNNMMIQGAGAEIDELLRERQSQAPSSAASGVDNDDDGTDEPSEAPKTTKRKSKASAATKEKTPKNKAASKATKTKTELATGADTATVVSAGLPVEVVPDTTSAAETDKPQEKVKKPRKSKKVAPVVLDTVAVEDGPFEDAEIKEMFAELSKGKGYVTEKALRSWGEIQELLQANLLTPHDLDYHLRELDLPASGKLEYPQFEKFVHQLDEVLIDENGDFLPADQKHRAVNLDGVSEFDE